MYRKGVGSLSVLVAVALSGCGDLDHPLRQPSTPGVAVNSENSAVDARTEYARAVENDDADQARVWGARALAEVFPDDSAEGLRVDPHIFAPYPKNETVIMGFDTSIRVRTTQRDQARNALERCTDRLSGVSYTGKEFATEEELQDSLGAGQFLGTDDDIPSWVSEPQVRDDGVGIVFDSAWMRLPMMVTMINIVREELRAAGVTDAFITSDSE